MNKVTKRNIFTVLMLGLASPMAWSQDISGIWEGNLEAAPGTEITVRFELSTDGSGYQAVLNSPDTGAIKNVQAGEVEFDGSQLTITVPALSGSYDGAWNGQGFTGEWTQPGAVLPMNLVAYEAMAIPQDVIDTLLGQWSGKLELPAGEFNIVFHFEMNEDGEFTGAIQNADAGPARQVMADIRLEEGELMFRVPQANADYRGTLSGDTVTGNLTQGAQSMALNVSRGGFEPVLPELSLSDADMEILEGTWTGEMGPLTIVLNFLRNEQGVIYATVDSPVQNVEGLPVTVASLSSNNRLVVELSVINAQFQGTVAGDTVDGAWTQGGMTQALVLSRNGNESVP